MTKRIFTLVALLCLLAELLIFERRNKKINLEKILRPGTQEHKTKNS